MKLTNSTVLDFRQAQLSDLATVLDILTEAAAWLVEQGIDQWPSPPNEHWQRRMHEAVVREEVFTVGIVNNRFGIVRLTWQDELWPDDGLAGYVHTMAIRSAMHGQRVGRAILFWAAMRVQRARKRYVRLDCLATNGRLRHYYESVGFAFQRQVTDRDYVAALYQLDLQDAAQMAALGGMDASA